MEEPIEEPPSWAAGVNRCGNIVCLHSILSFGVCLLFGVAVLLLSLLWSLFFAEAESEAEAISEQATQAKRVVAVVVVVAVMAMAVLDVNCEERRESRTRVTAQYCAAAAPSSSLLPNDETE